MVLTIQERRRLRSVKGAMYNVGHNAMFARVNDMLDHAANFNRGRALGDIRNVGRDAIDVYLTTLGFDLTELEVIQFRNNIIEEALQHGATQDICSEFCFAHKEGGRRISYLIARGIHGKPDDTEYSVKSAVHEIIHDDVVMEYYGVCAARTHDGKDGIRSGLLGFYRDPTITTTMAGLVASPTACAMIDNWDFTTLVNLIHQSDIRRCDFGSRLNIAVFSRLTQQNLGGFDDGNVTSLGRLVCERYVDGLIERNCF